MNEIDNENDNASINASIENGVEDLTDKVTVEPEEVEIKKPRSKLSIAIEIGIYAVLIFVCLFIIPKYVLQRTSVSGQSMEDTLHNKESLLIDNISNIHVGRGCS